MLALEGSYNGWELKMGLYVCAGLAGKVKDTLQQGKSDFQRYAESGQLMINRAMHLGELWIGRWCCHAKQC